MRLVPLLQRASAPVAALLIHLALQAGLERLPPRAEEPLALRWARVAADHPVRTPLALALLLLALGPRRAAPPDVQERRTGEASELRIR